MIKSVYLLFGCVLIVCLSACNLEQARANQKQYVVIASDCLEPSNAEIFKRFEKTEGIKVKIIHLSADSIQYKLRTEGINCTIDAVILSSVFDINKLDNAKVLQTIPKESFPELLSNKYISKAQTWAGIGIDPYVLITKGDTLQKIKTYSNLLRENSWCTDLKNESDWYPFYSFVVNKNDSKSKFNAKDWITQLKSKEQKSHLFIDSLGPCKVNLTTYSRYKTNQSDSNSIYKKGKLVFPNQHIGGSYYNMVCFGIIKQAPNYTNGMKFFQYILQKTVNERLNNVLNKFPINSNKTSIYDYQQNLRFKKNHTSPVQLITNYDRLRTILSTIN